MILGTPKILRKAQKITNFEFEAHGNQIFCARKKIWSIIYF